MSPAAREPGKELMLGKGQLDASSVPGLFRGEIKA